MPVTIYYKPKECPSDDKYCEMCKLIWEDLPVDLQQRCSSEYNSFGSKKRSSRRHSKKHRRPSKKNSKKHRRPSKRHSRRRFGRLQDKYQKIMIEACEEAWNKLKFDEKEKLLEYFFSKKQQKIPDIAYNYDFEPRISDIKDIFLTENEEFDFFEVLLKDKKFDF
jgi:hypothetical protein